MAQRMESFKDHCRAALTRPLERSTKANRIRHTNEVPHIDARSHIMRENEFFRSYILPKHHLDKAFEAAIPMQNASLDHQTQCHSACNLSKITSAALTMGTARAQNARKPPRRTNEVPPIDAGSHFMRENTRFRAISNPQTSPGQSAPSGSRGA